MILPPPPDGGGGGEGVICAVPCTPTAYMCSSSNVILVLP